MNYIITTLQKILIAIWMEDAFQKNNISGTSFQKHIIFYGEGYLKYLVHDWYCIFW